ncbi:DUF883 family protein [Nitrosomonas communis]|jgi:ElaB/YqjD/DUF883 family membrane-anchored ribosome-binding protein|uniref:Membrane-anchored ribosome-binding protein, inhibits growth in stationary phase, ElaB/YqjD/DUF883 family n=1 Tax=Nitrosomonas communis TaxID=44574 RepID=A0A1I4W3P1_9PROT|nr:hypothetical protein [Nitrosomonas communis]SFN08121.1 Membrane-anchored ribosome-binding protein, inhibits growth in stationary phase, ElaB/YqjD/DUF883 family [Nitrosomonas communis]
MANTGDSNKEIASKEEQTKATAGNYRDVDSKEIDELKTEFAVLRDDLGSLVTSLKNLVGKQSEKVVGLAEDAKEIVRTQAKATGENAEKYIKERPLTSTLVAFGSGFVVGLLLSNKR